MAQSDVGTIHNLDAVERQALAYIVGELEKSRTHIVTDAFLPFLKSLDAGNRLLVILRTFEGLGVLTPETPPGNKWLKTPLAGRVFPAYWRIEGKAVVLHRDMLSKESGEETKLRQKPGRPADTDAKEDKRISEAWETGHYKRHGDFAQVLGLPEREVIKAIDRHRKRLKRTSDEPE
jgi:hypothetical protein